MDAHQPHDTLFKLSFSTAAWLAALLRVTLPARVANAIDWSSLELIGTEVIKDDFGKMHADLAAKARWLDGSGDIIFDIEHKSSDAPAVAVDSLVRCAVVSRWVLRRDPERETLPSAIGVLVAHAGHPWRGALSVGELVGLAGDHPGRELGPELRLVVQDLSAMTSAALLGQHLPDVPLLVLYFLKHVRDSSNLLIDLDLVAPQLQRVTASKDWVAHVDSLMYYLREVSTVPAEELQQFFENKVSPAAEKAFVSSAERLRAEGRAEGRTEGRTEGRAEGRTEGRAQDIVRILELRKVSLTDADRQRILTCTELEVLDAWLDKAVVAESAGQVFG